MQRIFIGVLLLFGMGTMDALCDIVPKWATDQLHLRDIIHESVRETQQWQQEDGSIYPSYLSVYKWDDEVEIFYFWLDYYVLSGDESVYESAKGIALTYVRRGVESDRFDHGYYEEKFFDTEHTLEGMIILANLAWLRPDDEEVVSALEDVVEHAGNFVKEPGYEEWFVPETSLMRSVRPGTREMDYNSWHAIDWVFNLQFVKMALATYYATGNDRYLEWSQAYLDGWIDVLQRNKEENGFYIMPASVDPYTGNIGPYSGVWWESAFEPGWGWPEAGNNAQRDMRGAFLDAYVLTGERQYLEALKQHVQTLFDNGSYYTPAHYYDGEAWIPEDDKVTAFMSSHIALLDEQIEPEFEEFMERWYDYQRYPDMELHLWAYRKFGGEEKIDAINARAIDNAQKRLANIQALTELPEEPDDFPTIGGYWGVTLVPFGGLASQRGEMPFKEVMYYDANKSLGLPNGLAALFVTKDDSSKTFQVCNTTDALHTIWVQNGFIKQAIRGVRVNGSEHTVLEDQLARIDIPANETVTVVLETQQMDDIEPPGSPQRPMLFVKIR